MLMLTILKSMLSWQVCNTRGLECYVRFLKWTKYANQSPFSLFQWVRVAEQCFLLYQSCVLHIQLQLILDICWNGFSFSGCFMHRLIQPQIQKSSNTWWQMSLGCSLLNSCCKLLKSNEFKVNLIDAMDFAHAKLFSVIYLELHPETAEHCSKLASKLWSTFP